MVTYDHIILILVTHCLGNPIGLFIQQRNAITAAETKSSSSTCAIIVIAWNFVHATSTFLAIKLWPHSPVTSSSNLKYPHYLSQMEEMNASTTKKPRLIVYSNKDQPAHTHN